MYDWLLNDAHLVLLVLIFVALITIVATLTRVRRAEFARLQNEVKQILDCVKSLEAAEQRRFIVELKSNCAGGECSKRHQGRGKFRKRPARRRTSEAETVTKISSRRSSPVLTKAKHAGKSAEAAIRQLRRHKISGTSSAPPPLKRHRRSYLSIGAPAWPTSRFAANIAKLPKLLRKP